jgi:hypothetical protein
LRLTLRTSINNELKIRITNDIHRIDRYGSDKAVTRDFTRLTNLVGEHSNAVTFFKSYYGTTENLKEKVELQKDFLGDREFQLHAAAYLNGERRIPLLADAMGYEKLVQQFSTPTPPTSATTAKRGGHTHLDLKEKLQRATPDNWKTIRIDEENLGKRFRPKRFGSNARHIFLESGAWVAANIPKEQSRFITITLPASTYEANALLADNSAYVVNRLFQYIRRQREEIYYFWAWEFQKRGALHMHLLIASPDCKSDRIQEISQGFVSKYYDLLGELSDESGIDMFATKYGKTHRNNPERWQNKIVMPEKDISKYCSKYLSKDGNAKKPWQKPDDSLCYPSRMWGSSSNLKTAIKAYREQVTLEYVTADEINDILNAIQEPIDCLEVKRLERIINNDWAYGIEETIYYEQKSFLGLVHPYLKEHLDGLLCYRNQLFEEVRIKDVNKTIQEHRKKRYALG